MSKKDFMRGVEVAAGANAAFMHKQAEATAELGRRIIQRIDEQGEIVEVVLDTLSEQEKKELYDLQSEYDIADLDENEKEVLASYLLTLISKYGQDSEPQKDYYFAVKKHLGVTNVSSDLDLSVVENVDSRTELKAILETVCEFLFLKTGDLSFLQEFEDEIDCFGLSRKVIGEVTARIEAVYAVLGLRGIVEHYIPAEKEEEEPRQTDDTARYTVLDWEADKEYCLQNGIEESEYTDIIRLVSTRECIVRNFPYIYIDSASVIDCVFENCERVNISQSFVTGCRFKNIGDFFIDNTKISQSIFEEFRAEGTVCYLDEVEIDHTIFRNIELTDEAYLFDASGYCQIRDSEFVNISTDREDMALYDYQITSGRGIFKTTSEGSLFDEDSCTGLDDIISTC